MLTVAIALLIAVSAPAAKNNAPPPMKCKVDEFKQTKFCEPPGQRLDDQLNGISLYTAESGKPGNKPRLRAIFAVHADTWIFAESVQFLVDGKPMKELPLSFDRDHNTAGVFETADIPCAESCQAVMETMLAGKVVKLRFNGKRTAKDMTLTASAKASMRRTLDYFNSIKK